MIDLVEVNKSYFETGAWEHTSYRGVPVFKYPTDLWIYQEIIAELKPDVIVETGTCQGGSSLYFADLLDILSPDGRVITVDIADQVKVKDDRINYVSGDSTSLETFQTVKSLVGDAKCVLVSLDSEHLQNHVFQELELYPTLVTVGSYLIVEDTFISRYNCQGVRFQEGSTWEALQQWLPANQNFIIDESRNKHILSMNPDGWLRKVS